MPRNPIPFPSSSLLFSFVFLLLFVTFSSIEMADSTTPSTTASDSSKKAAVHIVYMERTEGEEPEAYHIRTLSAVLGSEEAAREALVYSYRAAASGFSAKLTPEQVEEISKQPGVLQVVPSRTLQLHSGPGRVH